LRLSRRHALLAAPLLFATPSRAQGFPERSIRLVVPFPPGGATDGTARVLAEYLTTRYGRPVVVENRAGAGGVVGAEAVARATPDGLTWLLTSAAPVAIAPLLTRNLSFDPKRELAPVSMVMTTDHVMTVNPRSPARDVAGFIAMAKAAPKPLTYASSGNGTSLHLIGELFRLRAGIALEHAPYRGSAPAVTDLIAGTVDCMFDQLPASIEQVRSGLLRPLAMTGARRNAALPEVPLMSDTLPGFVAQSWNGVVVPAGTPPALIERIAADVAAALADSGVQAKLARFGADYAASSPAQMAAIIEEDIARWGPVIRDGGITAG